MFLKARRLANNRRDIRTQYPEFGQLMVAELGEFPLTSPFPAPAADCLNKVVQHASPRFRKVSIAISNRYLILHCTSRWKNESLICVLCIRCHNSIGIRTRTVRDRGVITYDFSINVFETLIEHSQKRMGAAHIYKFGGDQDLASKGHILLGDRSARLSYYLPFANDVLLPSAPQLDVAIRIAGLSGLG